MQKTIKKSGRGQAKVLGSKAGGVAEGVGGKAES